MKKHRNQPKDLSLAHRLCVYVLGYFLFIHALIFDFPLFFPRNPVSSLIPIILPRALKLTSPEFVYRLFSNYFDGDGTFYVLLLTYVVIYSVCYVSNHTDQLFYFSRKYKVFSFFNAFIWFLSPLLFIGTHLNYEIRHQNVKNIFETQDRIYDPLKYITNDFFKNKSELIQPKYTLTYKQGEKPHEKCSFEHDGEFNFPGDSPYDWPEAARSYELLVEQGILQLDVYEPRVKPALDEKKTVILHLHGGGWEKGHRRFLQMNYHGGLPSELLNEGYTIVSASYRFSCHGVDLGHMLEDVYDAAKYVRNNFRNWNITGHADEDVQIVPWGTSAGGTLALLLAYNHGVELGIPGVINFYGPTEFRESALRDMSKSFWEDFFTDVWITGTRHLCSSEECFEKYSVVTAVHPRVPPTLTIHGEGDGLVLFNQAEALAKELDGVGVKHWTVKVPGSHDCDVFISSPCSQVAIYGIKRLVEHISQ
eukprot:maker-scaffold_12-snap-gene-8.21-mRNA-1 protein AED:0.00 eAED:0.00 QI:64/1/1/1/1/1/3/188/477